MTQENKLHTRKNIIAFVDMTAAEQIEWIRLNNLDATRMFWFLEGYCHTQLEKLRALSGEKEKEE